MNRIKTIDILKTIAIIGVVLFHAGVFPNGYLGVEVFFVISGYLMMNRIKSQLEDRSFHPVRYLWSRVMRIWPLMAICGIVSLIVGYICMIPDDYENLAESVIASDTFSNNILLAISTRDYWNVINTYKPLMQTWYVAVLLQSLVFLVLVLWIVSRIRRWKKGIPITLVVITLVSLVLFFLPFFTEGEKFYYPPFRLYEITMGCLIAFFPKINWSEKRLRLIGNIGIVSILLVLFAGAGVGSWTVVSGPVKGSGDLGVFGMLITVVATVAVVWSHSAIDEDYGVSDRVFRIVTLPGKYSYEIYIWHQAVMAFLVYSVFQERNIWFVLLAVVITAAFSILSIFIRNGIQKWVNNMKKSLTRILVTVIGIAVFGVGGIMPAWYLYQHAGVVRDVPELDVFMNDVHRNMHADYVDGADRCNEGYPHEGKVHVLILGNSFGEDFANVLQESVYADRLGIYVMIGQPVEEEYVDWADIVFYGSDVWEVPDMLQEIPPEKLYIVGNKRFGYSNGVIYANRYKDWYYDQRFQLSDEMLLNNNAFLGIYGDHYVDMIAPMVDEDNRIRVFTDDNHFISQDCKHLTKRGAQFYARLLETRLGDIVGSFLRR